MKKLPYIEDYILLMSNTSLTWPPNDPIIKLARYDVSIVNSMADQVNQGLGFSDRQAVLAHKIVCKYKKQWALYGYDISHQESNGVFNLPIRIIDRSTSIGIDNNYIVIKFPYDQTLIGKIRADINIIPGKCVFDKDKRYWQADLIEPRIVWAYEFGIKHGFEFTTEFMNLYQDILDHTNHQIKLQPNNDRFIITNAAESLVKYIDQNGGFGFDNILKLVDLAGVLGYTVCDSVYSHIDVELTADIIRMMVERETRIEYDIGQDIDLTTVVQYAKLTDRFPIYVYEANSSVMRKQLLDFFTEDEIVDRKRSPTALADKPVVYFNHWRQADLEIPLLVTTHVLMIGNRRQQMLQCSNKIVYFSQRIDNDRMPTTDS